MSETRPRLAVLGAGVMGQTVLGAALAAGWSVDDITATVLDDDQAAQVARDHGVAAGLDNTTAVEGAGLIVIAVKPKDVAGLLATIAPHLEPGVIVASVVVGLPTSFYEKYLAGVAVVRIMPNTPAQVGSGVSAISAGTHADEQALALVEHLLAETGLVLRVDEKDQDAVGALSGSGPAYVFYVIDALAEAGVLLGLSRDVALQLATATVEGSAHMLAETGDHPALLRERVSSPGGTTVAALRQLDAGGVRASFLDAMEAARDRSRELAAALDRE